MLNNLNWILPLLHLRPSVLLKKKFRTTNKAIEAFIVAFTKYTRDRTRRLDWNDRGITSTAPAMPSDSTTKRTLKKLMIPPRSPSSLPKQGELIFVKISAPSQTVNFAL